MPEQSNPHIVILGAGPIGLEATLYARYLGYQVTLLERATSVAANVQEWGHVQLFSPFGMNASTLGVAAIQSHFPNWTCPAADLLQTGADYIEQYLQLLSETDLVASSLQTGVYVVAVGRAGWLKTEGVGDPERAKAEFHILVRRRDGSEQLITSDMVIDCTGTYGNHNWLGSAGVPALGEIASARKITYSLPDVLGQDREQYLGRHTLVVGAGYSAATVVTQIAQLASDAANTETKATWVTRHSGPPLSRIPDDRLAGRDALAIAANELASKSDNCITHRGGTGITSITYRDPTDDFEVVFEGEQADMFTFDRVVANVGYRPENRMYSELQLHECYASGGPMKLAAQLAAQKGNAADCMDQVSYGPESLVTTEPGFYILGSKSYGRSSNFLLSIGLQQIRDLFTILGEREDLDLYATMPAIGS
ncbi:MAG: NAD-binding protein [Planctomycetes bacterium]|nr:NAD-binding protein [Planctomycetota bacterium]